MRKYYDIVVVIYIYVDYLIYIYIYLYLPILDNNQVPTNLRALT